MSCAPPQKRPRHLGPTDLDQLEHEVAKKFKSTVVAVDHTSSALSPNETRDKKIVVSNGALSMTALPTISTTTTTIATTFKSPAAVDSHPEFSRNFVHKHGAKEEDLEEDDDDVKPPTIITNSRVNTPVFVRSVLNNNKAAVEPPTVTTNFVPKSPTFFLNEKALDEGRETTKEDLQKTVEAAAKGSSGATLDDTVTAYTDVLPPKKKPLLLRWYFWMILLLLCSNILTMGLYVQSKMKFDVAVIRSSLLTLIGNSSSLETFNDTFTLTESDPELRASYLEANVKSWQKRWNDLRKEVVRAEEICEERLRQQALFLQDQLVSSSNLLTINADEMTEQLLQLGE